MGPSAAGLAYGLLLLGALPQLITATPVASLNADSEIPGQVLLGESQIPLPNTPPQAAVEHDAVFVESESGEAAEESILAPSWWVSTLMARRLLALSTSGVVSTVFPDPLPPKSHTPAEVAGQSISLKEYYADCDEALPTGTGNGGDGSPTFLALYVATTFRNTAAGSNLSLSIDWWDHLNNTKPVFPGFPLSPAGLPRVTLFGYIEPFEKPIPKETESALRSCYTRAHPDAQVWLPGRPGSPHGSFWAKMVVTQVYWIGGFGGFQQIGWMNVTEWNGIRRWGSLAGVGDGRGWEDVRLPGETE
ncbi:pyridoxamine 5'-phosphate oxidase-domain-containing protein [Aspergillus pseudoustus]|uniref:Pyridoxamine 5'-phosphate oxidase-domain-containing protein n=1 Tax=Aspergillus pseudoustus TaxID=1810923 RepID=A0ABR4IZQ5_9EURO